MNLKKIMAGAVASVVAATSFATAASAADDGVSFKAGLTFQTNAWTFRNSISQSQAIWWDPDFGDQMEYDVWNYGDVDITGDGTYMVYFEKNVMDDCKDGPETYWNQLKLQTNIPLADYMETNEDGEDVPTVTITVEKLVVDGVEMPGAKDATTGSENLSVDDYSDGCNGITETVVNAITVGFVNTWNPDQTFIDATDSFGGRVMLVFTVSGLGGSGGNYTEGDEPEWQTLGGNEPSGDNEPAGDEEPAGDNEPSGDTPEESSTTTTAATTAAPSSSSDGNSALPLIIGGIAAAVVIVIIIVVVVVKKKK